MCKIFTIHDVPPMPDNTIDNFEGLSGSCPTLVHCEPIQPLEDQLNVIPSSKLLRDVLCFTFNQLLWRPLVGRTH
jgi:hypothetical protein